MGISALGLTVVDVKAGAPLSPVRLVLLARVEVHPDQERLLGGEDGGGGGGVAAAAAAQIPAQQQ